MKTEFFEKELQKEILFSGRVVTLHRDKVLLQDGSQTLREVIEHPGGVCILPLNEEDEVYTVCQYRYPVGQTLEELPAGKLEKGEDPDSAALRELSEEIGAVPEEFISLGSILPSPGFSTEVLHLYLARHLRFGEQHLDPGEFLEVRLQPMQTLVERIMSGEITDGKTVACVLKAREYIVRKGKD